MCGIAGLYDPDGRVDLGRLRTMGSLLRHRGPDDEGQVLIDTNSGAWIAMGGADTPREVFESRLPFSPGRTHGDTRNARFTLALAQRRLSIVDLSPAGHGPMSNSDGSLWITYNGEVYNHVELRQELEGLGHAFAGTCDTEVVLAAYRQWGTASFSRLNGMFGFAIWDAQRRELIAVRDRLGVKPFYYQFDGRRFAFASEPRALVLTQPSRILPRLDAVHDLVALDWVDHESSTFFDGLWQLPAGHWMSVSARGIAVHRWWSLDEGARASGDERDWTRQFAELFTDAVRIRLRADVEVGSCLSGGTDSSAVVTTASQLLERPLHAFSSAYDEGPAFDERPWIRAVVEASGAKSHVVVPDGSDFWATFDRIHDLQAEPTAGPGLYSQWKVMELAHGAGLKVLLDGQGGDETLAGYFRYLPIRIRDLVANGRFHAALGMLGPVADRLGLTTTLALAFEPWLPAALIAPLRRQFGQGKDRVLGAALRRIHREPPRPPHAFGSALRNQLAFDTTQRLLPSLLRYEDRNSMAFSIETRLPFLDYRLVEFAFSLPDDQKLEGDTTKSILRRALADRIPASVLARRDKMGFETPTDVWLRERFAGEVRRRLGSGLLDEWLEAPVIREELSGYLEGRRPIGLQVWRWLSLESWARRYVAADPRRVEKQPEEILHAGRHRTYTEVAERFEQETEASAIS
jgi:asparagine synthase (glutamine-hydrolysing)